SGSTAKDDAGTTRIGKALGRERVRRTASASQLLRRVIGFVFYLPVIVDLLGHIDFHFDVDSTWTTFERSTIDIWSENPPRT
ncbi:hypothetical protein OC834_005747, partial [Tilletia horrida]